MNIAVAGTGYVGLSLAVLLSQYNKVTAVDIVPEKVEKLNNYISPIQDEYIEKYLAEAKDGKRKLDLTATTDMQPIYRLNPFVTKNGNGRARSNAYIEGGCIDVGMDIFERGLCLPSDIKMKVEQQEKIIEIIKYCFS